MVGRIAELRRLTVLYHRQARGSNDVDERAALNDRASDATLRADEMELDPVPEPSCDG